MPTHNDQAAPPVQTVAVPDGLARSDAEFWLRRRGAIIDALRADGLSIVSTANGVQLMRLGKADAHLAAAPAAAPALPDGWTTLRMERVPGRPETVAYGQAEDMERLRKTLDALYTDQRAAQYRASLPAWPGALPQEPTPAILDALRTGSRKDWPSDELCRVRYAALLAAVQTPEAQP